MARPPRVSVDNMKSVMRRRADRARQPVNRPAHRRLHAPATIIYQTATTLDTNTGPGLRMPRAGRITRISGRVAGAPSSTMKINVLIDDFGVFQSGTFLQIQSGSKISEFKVIERPVFTRDSVITVDIDTIASATGPLVLTIEYVPGEF